MTRSGITLALALFDLDNTLIAGDSDYEWGRWLVRNNRVDADYYARTNERFYDDYKQGKLDIQAYLAFALEPLAALEPSELQALHREFMTQVIAALWLPAAEQLLARHRAEGDQLVVISATNRFVVEPICRKLQVEEIIATEPEVRAGRYTGNVAGTPSYGDGKVIRLREWLQGRNQTLAGSYFYSDSHSDLPLLREVTHPVAVDPDSELRREAEQRGWPIISLRG